MEIVHLQIVRTMICMINRRGYVRDPLLTIQMDLCKSPTHRCHTCSQVIFVSHINTDFSLLLCSLALNIITLNLIHAKGKDKLIYLL